MMDDGSKTQYEVSVGKTLLGNWVEERQVSHLDNCPKTIKELHMVGHSNVLTHRESDGNFETTCASAYKPCDIAQKSKSGKRRELLEKELYEKISAQVQTEMAPSIPPIDYTSTTRKDFTKEFQNNKPQPTMDHNVNTEMPLTFWKQNLQDIHGVTRVEQDNTPFKKNAAFSTPIAESKDDSKPGEEWKF